MEKELIVFSDVHYAKNWDTIDEFFRRITNRPVRYLNPNREFRRFVDMINDSPNVEAVINNGDSVDYHFSNYSTFTESLKNGDHSKRISNWELFNSIINRLKKPYLAIPGNHDYRMEAYNYAIWGTDHINLSRSERKRFRKQIGHQKFRGPLELKSILVNEKKFDPLVKSKRLLKRDERVLGKFHCVFLDNGSDAFVRPSNLLQYLAKFFRSRMISYDSVGLNKQDLDYVSLILSADTKQDILIFQHTPMINPKTSNPGQKYQLSIDSFRRVNMKQKISYSTIFNGGGRLLNSLRNTDKNVVIVASHIHNAKYFLIDKKSLRAKEVLIRDFNTERNNPCYIKHLTTLPLGVVCRKVGSSKTGFLKISAAGFEEMVLHNFDRSTQN